MAFEPLLLTGNLKINDVDVSDQVTSFAFTGTRDSIEIPATFGQRKSFRGGNDSYEVEISYLSDVDTTALTQIFWAALADADGTPEAGTVEVSGTLRPGAVSATNPEWSGVALVTGTSLGGEVNTVGTDSQTFPLQDRPTQSTGA